MRGGDRAIHHGTPRLRHGTGSEPPGRSSPSIFQVAVPRHGGGSRSRRGHFNPAVVVLRAEFDSPLRPEIREWVAPRRRRGSRQRWSRDRSALSETPRNTRCRSGWQGRARLPKGGRRTGARSMERRGMYSHRGDVELQKPTNSSCQTLTSAPKRCRATTMPSPARSTPTATVTPARLRPGPAEVAKPPSSQTIRIAIGPRNNSVHPGWRARRRIPPMGLRSTGSSNPRIACHHRLKGHYVAPPVAAPFCPDRARPSRFVRRYRARHGDVTRA